MDCFNKLGACLGEFKAQEKVHYRFSIDDRDLIHLPFELVLHPSRQRPLREFSPVSRQIVLKDYAVMRPYPKSACPRIGRVLCIVSNVRGVLAVDPDTTFGGSQSRYFDNLDALEKECAAVQNTYGNACTSLELKPGDPIGELEKVFKQQWDIVHFCGHSIRSDEKRHGIAGNERDVYIVLPGRTAGADLIPLPMTNFAELVGLAGARMLILSSCESSSVEALAEIARAGIPVGVGFRWEVMDTGANEFSKQLHTELVGGAPISRAFLHTLQYLMRRAASETDYEPAVVSTMLVVQGDAWVD